MKRIPILLILNICLLHFAHAQSCVATITADGPTTFCDGDSVKLSANVGGDKWIRKGDFGGVARQGATSFTIGDKGYIGTGQDAFGNMTNDFWEYDPTNDSWTQKANFAGGARINAAGFGIGNKGYLGTGFDVGNKRDFWEYDPSSNTWAQKSAFRGTARSLAASFSINNKGYIGTGKSGTRVNDFWEYDPTNDTWTQKAAFGGSGRYGATGFSISNRGYIGLGFDAANNYSKEFWEYNPSNNTWTQKANFGGVGRFIAVGFGIGNKGYIGTGMDGNSRKNDFWEYDPALNKWTAKANFGGNARRYSSGFSINGKGYLGLGQDQRGVIRKDMWEYEPSFTYEWSNGETASSIIVKSSGSYTVTVNNSSGSCSVTSNATDVVVKTASGITDISAAENPICNGSTTTLTANGVIGTNPVVNWWTGSGGTGINLGTGLTLNNVTEGTYYAEVTSECGLPQEASITISAKINAGITDATAAQSPICAVATTSLTANGVIGTNAVVNWWTGAGGTGTNLGNGNILSNVGPGTYYARVTADCGTPAEAAVTVDSYTNLTSDTTVVICNKFKWYDSTYIMSGDYTHTTTSVGGCDSIITLHLTILFVSSTYTKLDNACFADSSGTIIITPTSGDWPYTYRIGTVSSYGSDSIFHNLKAGKYRVSILDSKGCAGISDQVTIIETPAITSTVIIDSAKCFGVNSGKISVTPTSGVAPFQYKLGSSGTFGPSNEFNNLKAGTYRVFMQDATGCIGKTNSIKVEQPAMIGGNYTIVRPDCFASATGSLTVVPTSGVAPFSYKLGTVGSFGSSNTFTNLKGGSYRLFIEDATGCSGNSSVIISQPTIVSATTFKTDPSCKGKNDGSISITGAGGTPPYQYKFGTSGAYSSFNNFTKLQAGTYSVFVKDANNCGNISYQIILTDPPNACSKQTTGRFNPANNEENSSIFKVALLQNPAVSHFNLNVSSTSNQSVTVRVLDINGRKVFETKKGTGQSLSFGENLSPGIYLLEVSQGDQKRMIKAIKTE